MIKILFNEDQQNITIEFNNNSGRLYRRQFGSFSKKVTY